jgi:hypothetical protein
VGYIVEQPSDDYEIEEGAILSERVHQILLDRFNRYTGEQISKIESHICQLSERTREALWHNWERFHPRAVPPPPTGTYEACIRFDALEKHRDGRHVMTAEEEREMGVISPFLDKYNPRYNHAQYSRAVCDVRDRR